MMVLKIIFNLYDSLSLISLPTGYRTYEHLLVTSCDGTL